ncbi:MAG: FliI/YscN family ATPase [Acidimicrobiales bacterium]
MSTMTALRTELGRTTPFRRAGRLSRLSGLEVCAKGVKGAIGDLFWVHAASGTAEPVPAEVIAIADGEVRLLPLGALDGMAVGDWVEPAGTRLQLEVTPELAGRVLDALGRPIDGKGPLGGRRSARSSTGRAQPDAAPAHHRAAVARRAGHRHAAALRARPAHRHLRRIGVGKSTLLGMLARAPTPMRWWSASSGSAAVRCAKFLEDDLGPEGAARATVVVATSDEPALLRLRAAVTATRIAEWYADQGLDVLLLMDSLTRFAMAQREVGLAAGEPPTVRGYTPSVFNALPKLLERTGPQPRGTITALYTVLVEGDDLTEPITDHARSILDGHIVLSRRLASAGHFPTVDALESVSRLASKICTDEQLALAYRLRRLLAGLEESRDLIEIGAYVPGTNPVTDEALRRKDLITGFLQQPRNQVCPADEAWQLLEQVLR